jgi:antitoxin (DNA-binding transcriptional repressor) of toxin-antitoxin stability system
MTLFDEISNAKLNLNIWTRAVLAGGRVILLRDGKPVVELTKA